MYLFFDTETTGFVNKNVPFNDPKQARCCQLAAILTDENGVIKGELNSLVKRTNWSIHPKVTEIHGISDADCDARGRDMGEVLKDFNSLLVAAKKCIAHNFGYDTSIMEIESMNNPGFKWAPPSSFCTMLFSTDICKIPKTRGSGYKWPKLQEIHKFLFGVEFEDAHDALADVKATVRVFFELKKRGLILDEVVAEPASDLPPMAQ